MPVPSSMPRAATIITHKCVSPLPAPMVNVSDGAIANYAVWALPVRSTEVAPNVSSIMAAAMALAITTAPTKSVYPVR